MDIIIFNVELGQCVFFSPRSEKPEYAFMVDCGNTMNFEPIDEILKLNLLSQNSATSPEKKVLKNLTLTNYDQDHFSGLPYLLEKVHISTVRLPSNLSSEDIKKIKKEITKPIDEIIKLKDKYTDGVTDFNPPYSVNAFWLEKSDFPGEVIDTNKLSQVIFVAYNNSCICIPGDLTKDAWEKHLLNIKI